MGSLAPIASRPMFVAEGREAVAAALLGSYSAQAVNPAPAEAPALSIANRVQLDGLTLHYCRYDAPIDIDFPEMPGFRQFFHVSGSGLVRSKSGDLPVDADSTGVIAPQTRFRATYSGGYQHLVLQLDDKALLAKAEALTGYAWPDGLGLPALQQESAAAAWRLKLLVLTLAYQFAEPRDEDLAITELAQSVTTAFLLQHMSALPRLAAPPPDAGARALNRLEDYIHGHWNEALTVEAIAAACGVSPRSVFDRFRRERGMSPMTYARNVRLDNARRFLLSRESEASVLDVALKCGFSSFGHFAQRYRERFGELPSTTIARRPVGRSA